MNPNNFLDAQGQKLWGKTDIWRAIQTLKNRGQVREEIFTILRPQIVTGSPDAEIYRLIDEAFAPPKVEEPAPPKVEVLCSADDRRDEEDDAFDDVDADEEDDEPARPRVEVQRPTRKSKPQPEDEDEEEDDVDLLAAPDRRGYSVDKWFRPWARKSRGCKGGPITPDGFWYTAKDGRRRFVVGYRTRVEGKRKRDTLTFWAQQRAKAVAERRRGE